MLTSREQTVKREEFKAFLVKSVPIAKAMGVEVESIEKGQVTLSAPLDKNINHKQTAFGGSLHSVATLACWSCFHLKLIEVLKEEAPIVIVSSEISYLRPVSGDFFATCKGPDEESWGKFFKVFLKKGKGRLQLSAEIIYDNQVCVTYSGTFAAIRLPL